MATALFGLIFQVASGDTRRQHVLRHHLHVAKATVAVFHIHHQGQRIGNFTFADILFTHPVIAGPNHACGLVAEFAAAKHPHIRDSVLFDGIGKSAQISCFETGVSREFDATGIVEAGRKNVGFVIQHAAQDRARMLRGKAEFQKAFLRGFGRGGMA